MVKTRICVGSLNPVKIKATGEAFSNYFRGIEIFKINADSKVPDQPIGRDNIIKGAINRAKESLSFLREKEYESDFYAVGIEAGLEKVPQTNSGFMDFQYAVILDSMEHISVGAGIAFESPQSVIDSVFSKEKLEIGEIMGKMANNKNLKSQNGAIGFLSKNRIRRKDILSQAISCALLPIINKELYQE